MKGILIGLTDRLSHIRSGVPESGIVLFLSTVFKATFLAAPCPHPS